MLLVCRPHIQGMVYDAEGDPRGRVRITAGQRYPFQHQQYETHTAPDCSFDLAVDGGTYGLSVVAPGTPGGAQSGWYVPGGLTTNLGDASRVKVSSSGVTDVTIGLQTTFPISGVVLGPDGRPERGIRVAAERGSGGSITGRYVTGSDGLFVLHVPGTEPASVSLFRQSRGNNTWYSAGWYGPGGCTTIRTDASFIAPGGPEAVDIEIVLPAFRTIAGFILEPDGEGRGDVFVRAFRDSVQLANFTRANGRFAFSMPEGPVRLAFGTGVPSGRGRVVRHFGWYGDGAVTTAPSQASEIDLSGEDVELRLRIPTLRRITGWVRLPDTIDLPEATAPGAVSIRLLSYAGGSGEYLTEVLATDDGNFELAVIDGVYALQLIVHGDYTMTVGAHDPVSRVTSACGPPTPFTIETDARAREITLTQEMIEGRACP